MVAFRNSWRPKCEVIPDLSKLGSSGRVDYVPPPSSQDVDKTLSREAFSHSVGRGSGVVSYDGARVPSNNPCEDAYIHGRFHSPWGGGGAEWMSWGVFDGHCGWQLSKLLTKQLMPFVQAELSRLRPAEDGSVPEEAIHGALKTAFTKLDDALVKSALETIENDDLSFAEKIKRLEPAYAGSCVLLTLYDPNTSSLHIASTGDCRAVLGKKSANGKYETMALTVDQTGANADEAARIKARFPDEPDVVTGGRIWGMQPSRTFGDGCWKWDKDLRQKLRSEYNAPRLPSGVRYADYQIGPYLTALPEVSTIKIHRDGPPSFMILATDGLWDSMTNEQAVSLVGRWSDLRKGPTRKEVKAATATQTGDGFGPVTFGKKWCYFDEKRATFRDANAAVHLVRNGLGGAHDEMVRGALAFCAPLSREIRDDITVQVVFFEGKSSISM